jgi:hypothetical protein
VPELFERPKLSPDCLSAWQISQLAISSLGAADEQRARAHLAGCAHCAERLAAEAAAVAAATLEPIPAAVRAASAAGSRRAASGWGWRWLAMSGVAATAVVLVAVLVAGPDEARLRAKGELLVSVTVWRDGVLVADEVAVETLPPLVAGDRLRVRVGGAGEAGWVALFGLEAGAWVRYVGGPLPRDGWLAPGIEVTAAAGTALRVVLCASSPEESQLEEAIARGSCRERRVTLEVGP